MGGGEESTERPVHVRLPPLPCASHVMHELCGVGDSMVDMSGLNCSPPEQPAASLLACYAPAKAIAALQCWPSCIWASNASHRSDGVLYPMQLLQADSQQGCSACAQDQRLKVIPPVFYPTLQLDPGTAAEPRADWETPVTEAVRMIPWNAFVQGPGSQQAPEPQQPPGPMPQVCYLACTDS